jgi:hypothetical protein
MAQNSDFGAVPHGRPVSLRVWVYVAAALVVRPRLWWTAVRQWFRFVPRGWWRRPPHLPVPPRRYLEFRLETAFGPDEHASAVDIVDYLDWVHGQRR